MVSGDIGDHGRSVFKARAVLRALLLPLTLMLLMGCNDWPPDTMFTPGEVPSNLEDVDPWIAKLLQSDVASAKALLNKRLATDNPSIEPLVGQMSEYFPCQVSFSSRIGYLRCLRRYWDMESGQYMYDRIYIAQPQSEELLLSRLDFFDPSVRPLAKSFMQRFAGSGEEMEGMAGQFTYVNWPSASDFGSRNENSFGDWRDARLLYAGMNGDSVFIKPDGSTAWHVMETDDMIPIAATLEQFIAIYSGFRKTHDVFDSWAYRKFKNQDRTK